MFWQPFKEAGEGEASHTDASVTLQVTITLDLPYL